MISGSIFFANSSIRKTKYNTPPPPPHHLYHPPRTLRNDSHATLSHSLNTDGSAPGPLLTAHCALLHTSLKPLTLVSPKINASQLHTLAPPIFLSVPINPISRAASHRYTLHYRHPQ